jgi:multidrug resistance efflux pump
MAADPRPDRTDPPETLGIGAPVPPRPGPRPLNDDSALTGLQALLKVEATARDLAKIDELQFLIANETRKLTKARQVFVLRNTGKMRLVAISGLPAVDRNSPIVRGIEEVMAALAGKSDFGDMQQFTLADHDAGKEGFLARYPYESLLWLPFRIHCGPVIGGMLLASERTWNDGECLIARRLAGAFGHAYAMLQVEDSAFKRLTDRYSKYRKVAAVSLVALLAVLALPVQMTALAPMEITPAEPYIIAAPIDGVIADVLVLPNDQVAADQTIVKFEDTDLRNRVEVAEREVLVAEAREKKARQQAFDDVQGRHDLGLTVAEYALKTAELQFAREMFDRTTLKAPRDGVAIFADRQELLGKPVELGERIMQIADPSKIEVSVDVAVQDSIVLQPGAQVKVFLDSDPTSALEAKVKSADYQARVTPGNNLAFRVVAELSDPEAGQPRLGARGTAQLYGERVPLAFYLFRRPLSALRQWVGI